MIKTKAILILPYFGKFNDYFPLWLSSCGYNKSFNWLLITDIDISEPIPQNVHVVKMTFEELREIFKNKLGLAISLSVPYKLCDFRALYGYLFQEYLVGYDFWGYCDCDLVFGNLEEFIDDSKFEQYDKLFRTGHLSFVRNSKEINENFKNYNTYKMTLTNPTFYGYDESIDGYHLGFAGELLDKGFSFYNNENIVADIDFRHFPFHIVSEPSFPCVFSYEDGKIYRITNTNGMLEKKEMLYIHLQKRKMSYIPNIKDNNYLIYPNEIVPYDKNKLDSDVFWENVTREKNNYFNFSKERRQNNKRDLMRLLYEPYKIDSILYRIKQRYKK